MLIFEIYGHVPNHSGCSPAVQRHQAQPGIQQLAPLQEGDQTSVPQLDIAKNAGFDKASRHPPTSKRAGKKKCASSIQKTITYDNQKLCHPFSEGYFLKIASVWPIKIQTAWSDGVNMFVLYRLKEGITGDSSPGCDFSDSLNHGTCDNSKMVGL